MKKLLLSLVAIIMGGFMVVTPAFAECTQEQLDNGCVSTSIIDNGCSCDSGDGASIKKTLRLVVDIISMGIGILAVIGVIVSGLQYLTAGDSEEKTRKAKRRIVEIVIGIAIYVLMYAILTFLIPDFNPTL